jgi:hypothetical protein
MGACSARYDFLLITLTLLIFLLELKRSVAGFPPRRLGFEPGTSHVGFVVDKVAQGQVFSEYIGLSCQSSIRQIFHNHHHLSSGAGTIGQ